MLLDDLEEFLTVKSKEFDGDFIAFLELILVKYKCLFSKQTKIISKKWIKKIKQKTQGITKINIQFEEENIVKQSDGKLFLDTPFLPPPKGYITIEGGLKNHQIKKMLSFLYLENNGGIEPFISEESLMEVFKYGLAYPEKEPKIKHFKFNLDAPKTQKIIGFFFQQMYSAHKDMFSKRDYKNHFAKLLKHNFSNFQGLSLGDIRNLMRPSPPKSLKPRLLESFLKNYKPN